MKVLIIAANAFSTVLNNGKTYEAMFSGFNKEDIAQLFTRPQDAQMIDYNFCNNYYSVSEVDVIKKLLNPIRSCGGSVDGKDILPQSAIYDSFKGSFIKHNVIIRDALWATNLWRNKNLKQWIDAINPDLIFLVAGGGGYLHSMGRWVSAYRNIPLAVFFTDDYLIHPHHKGLLGKMQYWRMKRFYKKTVRQASLAFCIGELMSEEYSQYFNRPFYPIINSIDKYPYIELSVSKTLTISYLGGLHLNRWQMIVRFASVLPTDVSVSVYTAAEITPEIKQAFENNNVTYKGCICGNELQQAMIDSDILLHVESDDEYNRSLTRLSVSTKIPEYLMAGRLVIGYGPPEVASMRLLSDNKLGIIFDSADDMQSIKSRLNAILADENLRTKYGQVAHEYAVNNFDRQKIALDFKTKLTQIIS